MTEYFSYFLMSIFSFFPFDYFQGNSKSNEYTPAEYVVISDRIIADTAKLLSKRHSMKVVGITGGMPDCVNVLGLSFQAKGPLSKEQLRELMVDCIQEFLKAINDNVQLRPYLKNYPFTFKELDMAIFVIDDQGRGILDPNLNSVGLCLGELRYMIKDKEEPYKYTIESQEDYEEALKIVKNNIK